MKSVFIMYEFYYKEFKNFLQITNLDISKIMSKCHNLKHYLVGLLYIFKPIG